MDSANILHLAEQFYAAAAAPEQWGAAVEGVAAVLDAGHVTLDMHGTGPIGGAMVATAGLDQGELARIL